MSSKHLGHETTPTHYITHCEWNSMPEMFSVGCNETGVTDRVNNRGENFRLIQHGWHDWKAAGEFIKKGLSKGWNTDKIAKVMDFIKDKK